MKPSVVYCTVIKFIKQKSFEFLLESWSARGVGAGVISWIDPPLVNIENNPSTFRLNNIHKLFNIVAGEAI